jgi:capsule biosynthesis phosphatase
VKVIVIDLDGTLTYDEPELDYADRRPRQDVIAKLREYRDQGFKIAVHTARNMRTHGSNLGAINAQTLPVILDWLARHEVPYDEVFVGKPWCGASGFYVDDKAVRPDEFVRMSHAEVLALVGHASQA